MEKWHKYEFVCPYCDGLFNYTITTFSVDYWKCPKCEGRLTLMSVADATISPTTQEGEKMDISTANNDLEIRNNIKQEMELLYGNEITELKNNLENKINDHNRALDTISNLRDKIHKFENMLSSYCQEATDPDMEFIKEIAELFDVRLTKDISFSATISVTGTMTIDLTDEVDVSDYLIDNLSVDSYNGDISIDNFSVDDVNEDY
jgi:ribosome-binding protein aMBF1 (putative translation factor)